MKQLSQKQSSEEIDYAYKVIDGFKLAFDKAQANPALIDIVYGEVLGKLGTLLEAIMIITEREHRQAVFELAKSYLGMVSAWAKSQ